MKQSQKVKASMDQGFIDEVQEYVSIMEELAYTLKKFITRFERKNESVESSFEYSESNEQSAQYEEQPSKIKKISKRIQKLQNN